MWRALLLIKASFLSACIYIPTFEEEPYKEEDRVAVQIQQTTREQVIALFGQPTVSRENDQIWIYNEARLKGIIWILPDKLAPHLDFQFILIEFENDIVSNIEYIEDVIGFSKNSGCSSSGICLRSGFLGEDPSEMLITSKGEHDRMAKGFRQIPEMCSLYIYTEELGAKVEIDSKLHFMIDDTYFHALFQPGIKTIVYPALPPQAFGGFYMPREVIERLQFECQAGSIKFLELQYDAPFWRRFRFYITQVDDETGRQAIMDKQEIELLP